MMRAATVALSLLLTSNAPAEANAAWRQFDRAARASCKSLALVMARRSEIAHFAGRISGVGGEDGDQYYGLIARGIQSGHAQAWLCLYDKHSRRAQLREIGN